MQKIISLFQRNYDGNRLVRDEVVPGAEWVPAGEGVATQKMDGTCCMIRAYELFKRYDVKKGRKAPPGFEPAQAPDPITGHWPGWVPVGDGPEDRWHNEAFETLCMDRCDLGDVPLDGTYELIGPKVQGNPYGMDAHQLERHGALEMPDAPRTFDALKEWLAEHDVEGIIWHHPDGRMVKIKKRDFGFVWPLELVKA